MLHIANADHPLGWWPPGSGKGIAILEASLLAFYSVVVSAKPRPTFAWQLKFSDGGLGITVGNLSEQPTALTRWEATTSDGQRDCRHVDLPSAYGVLRTPRPRH